MEFSLQAAQLDSTHKIATVECRIKQPKERKPRMKHESRTAATLAAGFCICATVAIPTCLWLPSAPQKPGVEVVVRGDNAEVPQTVIPRAPSAPLGPPGSFHGVVRYDGVPPPREVLVRKNDPNVKDKEFCAAQEIPSERLLVNEHADNGLQNVIVYLRKAPEGYEAPPVPTEPAVMNSIGCRYSPHVLALRCGQTLIFKNDDRTPHNFHFTPLRYNVFQPLITPNSSECQRFTFELPEPRPVKVVCDLHDWMRAYFFPLDHPFVAVSDAKGQFRIDGLPPGEHKFRVWHELPGYLQKQLVVEIRSGEDVEMTLSYPPEAFESR